MSAQALDASLGPVGSLVLTPGCMVGAEALEPPATGPKAGAGRAGGRAAAALERPPVRAESFTAWQGPPEHLAPSVAGEEGLCPCGRTPFCSLTLAMHAPRRCC